MAKKQKITKRQIMKMYRKANRELAPRGPRGGAHKTHKLDIQEKQSNTIKEYDKDD